MSVQASSIDANSRLEERIANTDYTFGLNNATTKYMGVKGAAEVLR
jgi:hypothetical protein